MNSWAGGDSALLRELERLSSVSAQDEWFEPARQGRAEVHDYHDVATLILAASLPRLVPGDRTLGLVRASDGKRV